MELVPGEAVSSRHHPLIRHERPATHVGTFVGYTDLPGPLPRLRTATTCDAWLADYTTGGCPGKKGREGQALLWPHSGPWPRHPDMLRLSSESEVHPSLASFPTPRISSCENVLLKCHGSPFLLSLPCPPSLSLTNPPSFINHKSGQITGLLSFFIAPHDLKIHSRGWREMAQQ